MRVFPRSVTDRDMALSLYNNHFCSIWKSGNISSKKAKSYTRIQR